MFKLLLEGAINALGKVGLMLNVRRENLAAVPSNSARLADPDHFALKRRELAGHEYRAGRSDRASHHPAPERSRRTRHRGIPIEQDRALT